MRNQFVVVALAGAAVIAIGVFTQEAKAAPAGKIAAAAKVGLAKPPGSSSSRSSSSHSSYNSSHSSYNSSYRSSYGSSYGSSYCRPYNYGCYPSCYSSCYPTCSFTYCPPPCVVSTYCPPPVVVTQCCPPQEVVVAPVCTYPTTCCYSTCSYQGYGCVPQFGSRYNSYNHYNSHYNSHYSGSRGRK
jgi:hypothetical protein